MARENRRTKRVFEEKPTLCGTAALAVDRCSANQVTKRCSAELNTGVAHTRGVTFGVKIHGLWVEVRTTRWDEKRSPAAGNRTRRDAPKFFTPWPTLTSGA